MLFFVVYKRVLFFIRILTIDDASVVRHTKPKTVL